MREDVKIEMRLRTLAALAVCCSESGGGHRPELAHIHVAPPGEDGLSRICATDGRVAMVTYVEPTIHAEASNLVPFPEDGLLVPRTLLPPLGPLTGGPEKIVQVVYRDGVIGVADMDGVLTTRKMPEGVYPRGADETFRNHFDDKHSEAVTECDLSAELGETLWVAAATFSPTTVNNFYGRGRAQLRKRDSGPFLRLTIKPPGLPMARFVQMGLRDTPYEGE